MVRMHVEGFNSVQIFFEAKRHIVSERMGLQQEHIVGFEFFNEIFKGRVS